MKEIVIISGKGGTGKTSFAGSFAALANNAVFADCDVDAANLSLLMHPEREETNEFKASKEAFINQEHCVRCGLCQELCRFGAVTDDFQVDSLSCEGCGVCYHACPEGAITFEDVVSGEWFISATPFGPLVHARLGIAEENSGKLVTLIRNKAKELAEVQGKSLIISDGPPGIGCPVIASLGGASAALVVTEPTLSAVHDMKRVLEVCRHFQVPALVCINRFDLHEKNSQEIESFCAEKGVPLVGKVPFDRVVTEAMTKGLPLVEFSKGETAKRMCEVWEQVAERVG
ncbi:MAG: ATP-binding protein [Dethiobacteria bacterium]|jgi:MinD superfamily P-loop ATPase|nr:4Fe-4S binding protein [Bacillota bacterium]